MFSKADIQQVAKTADILQVVSSRVQLKPAGNYFKGLCPFHSEKTPSFTVSIVRNTYHCFGCGAHGDAIKFLMQAQNYTFIEAVESLAQRFGVYLKKVDNQQNQRDASLYSCLEQAGGYYEKCLKLIDSNSLVKRYLNSRQLKAETLKTFAVGYAPAQKDGVQQALKGDFEVSLLLQSGLVSEGKYGAFDFLRQRLVFPIRDTYGKIIGFAGRALEESQQPKYLNSKETPLYHKSRVFYGFYEALNAVREKQSVILVEGYTDVLRMHEQGFLNTVATCGTALTKEHLQILLKKSINKLILLLDADVAGKKAAVRSCQLCLGSGLNTFVATLPEGEDPDSFLSHNPAGSLQTLLDTAVESYDFLVQNAKQRAAFFESVEEQRAVFEELVNFCHTLKDSFRQQALQKKIQQAFGVQFELQRTPAPSLVAAPEPNVAKVQQLKEQELKNPMEFGLIRRLLLYPAMVDLIKNIVNPQDFTDVRLQKIYHGLTQLDAQDIKKSLIWEDLFVLHRNLVAYLQISTPQESFAELSVIRYARNVCKRQFNVSAQYLGLNSTQRVESSAGQHEQNLDELYKKWQKKDQILQRLLDEVNSQKTRVL